MNHILSFSCRQLVCGSLCAVMLAWSLGELPRARAGETFPDPAPIVKTSEWRLTPAKEPTPALKYRLSSDLADFVPGNAAVHYNRAILHIAKWHRETPERLERQSEWYDLPIDKLDVGELRKYVDSRFYVLQELKRASQCETCDWGYPLPGSTRDGRDQ